MVAMRDFSIVETPHAQRCSFALLFLTDGIGFRFSQIPNGFDFQFHGSNVPNVADGVECVSVTTRFVRIPIRRIL